MRLLFCIKAMNNPGGGAERVLADVANGLSRRGHQVGLLTFEKPGGASFYPLDERIERIGLGIGSATRPAGLVETARRLPALRAAVTAYAPHVAIGFMHSMYVPLALALAKSGVRIIGSEHIVPAHYSTRPVQRTMRWLAVPLLDTITVVSEAVKTEHSRRLRQKMTVAPNPLAFTVAEPADVVASGKQKRILSVGRLVAQKDHETLVRAFAAIADRFPDWALRIVGDGELEGQLKSLAARLGIAERVQLPGSTPDVGQEYAAAQLFVVPSRYESFGLATAEALVHGLPVIGFSDCPGTNELVREGANGILVRGADRVTALGEAMATLMLDPGKRRQLSGSGAEVVATHGIEVVLDRWEALLSRRSATARPAAAIG